MKFQLSTFQLVIINYNLIYIFLSYFKFIECKIILFNVIYSQKS